jgi:hypothetical protein
MHIPEVSPYGDSELSVFSDDCGPFDIDAAADTEYLTPQEIADLLKVSTDTVVRKFENRTGVLDLGNSESRFTRRYRVLRIPRTVFEAFVIETSVT